MIGKNYGKSNKMLGYFVLHMKPEVIKKMVSKILKCQVILKSKNESKKKVNVDIFLCENSWPLTQGRHKNLKGKFLSPKIIACA